MAIATLRTPAYRQVPLRVNPAVIDTVRFAFIIRKQYRLWVMVFTDRCGNVHIFFTRRLYGCLPSCNNNVCVCTFM